MNRLPPSAQGLLLVLLALTACGLPGCASGPSGADAQGEYAARRTEGRVPGGRPYRPLQSKRDRTPSIAARATIGRLRREATLRPSGPSLHAAGRALLLHGDVPQAIDLLEASEAYNSRDANVLSDLAVAYMARAADEEREDDWGRALVVAEKAVRLNPLHVEASYNRALALRQLGLYDRAAWATDAVLLLETDGAWRDEALRLRESLARPVAHPQAPLTRYRLTVSAGPFEAAAAFVTADRQQAREFFEDSLVARAPSTVSELDVKEPWADQAVAFARALSAEGDMLPVEIARIHTGARGRSREAIDIANRYWTLGRQQYARYEMANMASSFGSAAAHYARAGSPMALWARHYGVVGLYFRGRIEEAERECMRLLAVAESGRYRTLRARLRWDLGTLHYQRGHFERALSLYGLAQREFAELNEHENVVGTHQLLAESFGRLGDAAGSWSHHRAALRGLARVYDRRRRQTVLAAAGYSAMNLNMPEVALHCFESAVHQATLLGAPAVLVEARLNRARALLAVGRPGEAQADLAQGEQLLKRVGDAAMLNRFGADLLAARAEAYLESSPVTAYRDAMTALARIRNAGSEFRFAQLRLLAGRAALNLGDEGDAVRQFEHGIAHLESRRAVIQQRNLRVSFMDSVWSLYEERIQCAVRRGAHAEAVSWVERSRARMLLDELKGVGRPTLTATQIQERLKPGHALLLFVAGPQQLLGWLVTNRSLDFAAVPVPAATLRGQVKRLTKSLEAREADSVRQLARSLGAVVVDPLNLTGRGLSVLAISPGDALEAVPFAALIDRRGSHVVRSVATVVVPSGSTLAAVRPKARPMERLALIGEPQLRGVSRSATLLGARAEAAAIRELYPSSVMVEGAAATPRAFLAALEDADVVHFAGHAVGDASRPWQARLLLSGSTSDDDGALTLAQLRAGRSLAEVVVLAACDTGTGSGSAGEGLLSLSRPLLASGVRSVVVSKWRVVDDDMRVLNQAFHVHLRKPGAGPAAALRHAQLALLEAGGPHAAVHVWAMLEVQGSIN